MRHSSVKRAEPSDMSIDDMGQAETDGLDVRVPPSNRNGVVAPIVIRIGAGRVTEEVRSEPALP